MPIIEVLGTPRSGKTESLDKLSFNHQYKYFKERFDINPYTQDKLFNYNLWYAKHVIKCLKRARKSNQYCIFDRGIVDRLVFGKALFKYGKFTKRQYAVYFNLLRPCLSKEDFGLVVIISPKQSLRQVKSRKVNITRDINFLKILNQTYLWAAKKFPNYKVLRPRSKAHNLFKLLQSNIDAVTRG